LTVDEMPSLEVPDKVRRAVPECAAHEAAVVVVDFQGVVLGLNGPAEELFGMSSDDIAGEFVEMLVPSDRRWGHQAYRRGYQVEPREREMDPGLYPEAETAEDELVPIAVRLQPVHVDGRLYVAAHVQRDESPRPEKD